MISYKILKTAALSLGLSLMMSAAYADTYFYNNPYTDNESTVTDKASSIPQESSAVKDDHTQFTHRYQLSNPSV